MSVMGTWQARARQHVASRTCGLACVLSVSVFCSTIIFTMVLGGRFLQRLFPRVSLQVPKTMICQMIGIYV
jgi:hypothetical protein